MNKTQYLNETANLFWKTSAPVVFQNKIKETSTKKSSVSNSRPNTKARYFHMRKKIKAAGYESLERKQIEPPLNMAYVYLNPNFQVKSREVKRRFLISGIKRSKTIGATKSFQGPKNPK
mmetsp:Transcript_1081/g.957  ORF Transcript_1081/g.957 Transcript_1081/m.957 type:complete len:119 (+) Transcript_1081:355-711(+)